MSKLNPRKDRETAGQINEALALQREFGDDAARVYLHERGVRDALSERALTAPAEQIRYYAELTGRRA